MLDGQKHGTKKDSWFSHLAIEVPGENTSNEWCEPVNDEELLKSLKADHQLIITLEDGELFGGYGQMIASFYGMDNMQVKNYGISKKFHTDFDADELLKENGMSVDNLVDVIEKNVK